MAKEAGPVQAGVHLRRTVVSGAVAAGAFATTLVTTLVAEAVAAKNHRFLPAEPVLEIDAVLGPDGGEPLTLAVLGDSTVAGVGADRPEDTLTYGVAKALADRYQVTLHALGVSGSRLCDVVDQQLPQLAALAPDVVLVCVGTNDVTHCTPGWSLRRQLRQLAEGLPEVAPGALLIVSGLPPAEAALCFHRPLRDLLGVRAWQLTRMYKAALAPRGIVVLDIAGETRTAFLGKREMFSADLFHPSSAGYAYLGRYYGRLVRTLVDDRATQPSSAPVTVSTELASGLVG